jgi:hypothetical protein
MKKRIWKNDVREWLYGRLKKREIASWIKTYHKRGRSFSNETKVLLLIHMSNIAVLSLERDDHSVVKNNKRNNHRHQGLHAPRSVEFDFCLCVVCCCEWASYRLLSTKDRRFPLARERLERTTGYVRSCWWKTFSPSWKFYLPAAFLDTVLPKMVDFP